MKPIYSKLLILTLVFAPILIADDNFPQFDENEINYIRKKAYAAGISNMYIMQGNPEVFEGQGKIIYWNAAARKVYGSLYNIKQLGWISAEIGANGKDVIDEMFKSQKIKEGYVEYILYECWHPKYVKSNTNNKILLHEHWVNNEVMRAFVNKN